MYKKGVPVREVPRNAGMFEARLMHTAPNGQLYLLALQRKKEDVKVRGWCGVLF